MRTFAARLNPDRRDGLWYSKYPTQYEYEGLYEGAVMNGFHEAANYLNEDGLVRGYLPPRHAIEIRDGKPFILITVTPVSAADNADLITGIQAYCQYRGPENGKGLPRFGGPRNAAPIRFHYSCPSRLSLLFTKPLPSACGLLLARDQSWGRGPTKGLTKADIAARVIEKAVRAGNVDGARATEVLKALHGNRDVDLFGPDSPFNHDTLTLMDAKGTPKGNVSPVQRTVETLAYTRDPRVAAYALRKARGRCGDCKKPAPFTRLATGHPFLEVHHIHMLKDGGTDTPDNVIALCPNCHRKRHYG